MASIDPRSRTIAGAGFVALALSALLALGSLRDAPSPVATSSSQVPPGVGEQLDTSDEPPPLPEQPLLAGDYALIDLDSQDTAPGLQGVILTLSDFPIPITQRTLRYVEQFGVDEKGRESFFARVRRSSRYREHIERALRYANVPEDLLFLAAIESGFNPQAVSNKGAVGLFQLMPETATRFGLAIGTDVDERRSITRSTEAAIAYLTLLFDRYKRWDLALAAYNCGEDRLDQALVAAHEKLHRGVDEVVAFHELAENDLLPRETANFVPMIHAFAIVSHNRNLLGLDDPNPPASMEFAEVAVPAGTRVSAIAHAAGVSLSTLRDYNPDLLSDHLPRGQGDVLVNVPADRLERTVAALPLLLSKEKSTLVSSEDTSAGTDATPEATTDGKPHDGAAKSAGSAVASSKTGKAPAKSDDSSTQSSAHPGAMVLANGLVVEFKSESATEVELSARVELVDPLKNRRPLGETITLAAVKAKPSSVATSLDGVGRDVRSLLLGDAAKKLRAHLTKSRKRLYDKIPVSAPFVELSQRMFPKGHPMNGALLVGLTEPADDMFLEPEPDWAMDTVITVKGPVDADALATSVEHAFSDSFVVAQPPALPTASRATLGDGKRRLLVGWASNPLTASDQAAMHLAFMLACHNKVGRLHRALRHDKKLAELVNCSLEIAPLATVAWVIASPSHPHTVSDAEKAVDDAVAALMNDGPSDTELAAARGFLRTELARELQSASIRGLPKSRVSARNKAILSKIDEVDRAQVMAAAKALFSKDHRVVVASG
ncbi:MAG: transglycosylase SLT domain-containing protein [Polyangiaceae bacterium]